MLFLTRRTDWLAANGWIIGAAVLSLAGLYPFSPVKYRCLDKCQAALGFVISHWHGAREKWHALLLGGRRGAFCVGCCWSLILLTFVLGIGSIGWMLALGMVMATEKNLLGGRHLAAPIGAILLLAALWIALTGATASY